MANPNLVTAPTVEALTLDEVKDHLRITSTDQDARLEAMIRAARVVFENYCQRALMTSTWDAYFDTFPDEFRLPAPLTSVTSVKYYDTANAEQTLAATYYVVDTSREPARVTLAYSYSWPTIYDRPGCVVVRYVSGYANQAAVPEDIKIGLLWWIEGVYDGRPELELIALAMFNNYRWWPV